MSRFVNRSLTRPVPLGPCDCPGTPHDEDKADIRAELSAQEVADFVNSADGEPTAEQMALLIVGWNLLGPDGEPVPITTAAILDLFQPTVDALLSAITTVARESQQRGQAPNASSARSESGSPASGSPTPTTTTPA